MWKPTIVTSLKSSFKLHRPAWMDTIWAKDVQCSISANQLTSRTNAVIYQYLPLADPSSATVYLGTQRPVYKCLTRWCHSSRVNSFLAGNGVNSHNTCHARVQSLWDGPVVLTFSYEVNTITSYDCEENLCCISLAQSPVYIIRFSTGIMLYESLTAVIRM